MDDKRIEHALSKLRRSSAMSMLMIAAGAVFLVGALYYSATRLTPLEQKIQALQTSEAEMSRKITVLNGELEEKRKELVEVETRLRKLDEALPLLQAGTRHLMSREYPEAIKSYQDFLAVSPDSSEAHNFLGYAEFRYAKSLEDPSAAKEHYDRARASLEKAVALQEGTAGRYRWAQYNLALLHFQLGDKEAALEAVAGTLAGSPAMVEMLCKDGQFRPMRLDDEIGARFVEIVDGVANARGLNTCWVTTARR
ncbi:tetratricopeptide repeat protein [Luteimonas viscosa]|nr:tetratricopeptide repeat protein [Luteimonas viscosa]